MQLQSLQCNHCGAEVEVSAATKFATCAHCGSRLAIVRTASSTYTELAEKVDQLHDRVERHFERLDRHSQLAELDRRWALERENYMVRSKNGAKHLPTRLESIIAGVVVTAFGVVWTLGALGMGIGFSNFGGGGFSPFAIAGCGMPLFGLVIIALGLYKSMSAYEKATKYERAKRRYEAERSRLFTSHDDQAN